MAQKKDDEDEDFHSAFEGLDFVKVVAYLRAQGMREADIGHRLFGPKLIRPETRVSPLLTEAKALRIFREIFDETCMNPSELADLRGRASRELYPTLLPLLRERSGGVLKDVRVFYSAHGLPTSRTWALYLARYADNCAWYVRELLSRSRRGIAVSWGKTLQEVVLALGRHERTSLEERRKRQQVIVIPTMGDPPGDPPPEGGATSSRVARGLSDVINGHSRDVPSLEGIASVLPPKYEVEAKNSHVREYIEERRGYLDVLGSRDGKRKGMITRVDTIVTSVGSFETSWQTYGPAGMVEPGMPVAELRKLSPGDIGCVLVPRDGIESDPDMKARFDRLTRLWTGITLSHYADVARRALETDAPGVVVCAIGQNKAEIVKELVVRLRLVNHLVIDQHLAKKLESLLQSPPSADAR